MTKEEVDELIKQIPDDAYQKYVEQQEELLKQSQSKGNNIFTLLVMFAPIIVAIIIGLSTTAKCAWLFYGLFNLGMGIFLTMNTAINVFMLKAQSTPKFAFWMVYFTLLTSMGLAIGLSL